jgi:tRNA threonylcarbamoyladenosine biosynthesis protein TsaE
MDAIFELPQIKQVAAAFWKANKHKKVWAFYAPMGAGKTTFIHTLCAEILQISSNISSPTFAIINEYNSALVGTVLHMDWYRLKDDQDAINAGVEDALFSGNLCLVEWPEKAHNLLPDETLHIYIEVFDEKTRRIYVLDETEVDN